MLYQDSEDLTEPSPAAMEQMMLVKANELFTLCDTEDKGFITKRDMQRLRSELPVSPDQLEIVFDSLDHDHNGYLTLEEFTEGFGSFLGMKSSSGSGKAIEADREEEKVPEGDIFEGNAGQQEDLHKIFGDMMMHIDARGVFRDEDVVRAMWTKLHCDEPDLVSSFEDFLSKTAADIKRSRGEFQTLEGILKSKSNEHEEEVKKLYEEMEFQMKREQQRILAQESAKEKQLREEMERALREKEQQLLEMQNRHQELEDRLAQLNLSEVTAKQDNQRLLQEKEALEGMLSESQESLEESRSYITLLQEQQRKEKKERARTSTKSAESDHKKIVQASKLTPEKSSSKTKKRAALHLSEGIALERETLVKQLDLLKDVNKRLLDDKDEAEAIEARRALAQQTEEPERHRRLVKQGSILAKYFPGGPVPPRQKSETLPEDLEENVTEIDIDDDGIEMDDLTAAKIFTFHGLDQHSVKTAAGRNVAANSDIVKRNGTLMKNDSGALDTNEKVLSGVGKGGLLKNSQVINFGYLMHEDSWASDTESEAVLKKKSQLWCQTESMETLQDVGDVQSEECPAAKVQRIFKVVFVGDSGVGKSSFIHRFCKNTFRASFRATIGVDFQVRPLLVDDSMVVLQLWDTAGQERYRSVTKQYFRKADGVIVMYDVTSEQSYLNVRSWMESVQMGVEEGTVISVIGNKTDVAETDPEHIKKVEDGARMAVEYNALFYETSAKSGSYVAEAMLGIASLLKDKEDKAIEAALTLTDPPKKKGCCK